MKEIQLHLISAKDSAVVFSDIPSDIFKMLSSILVTDDCRKITINGNNARIGKKSDKDYIVFAYSFDKDYIKSKKIFLNELSLMLESSSKLEDKIAIITERAESQSKRLIHNLKSLSAKINQEIFYLAGQNKLMNAYQESLNYLEEQVTEKPKETAKALISILKYGTALNTEFTAFNKLSGDVGLIKRENHKIHKLLLSIFYLFFQDFTDRNVQVYVEKSELEGNIDYDSIHVCLYHLIENSAKYIKMGSKLNVEISKNKAELSLIFDMQSLVVENDETDYIFEEGFSGKFAKAKQLQGSGIGLFIARKMARLNDGDLRFLNGKPSIADPHYARNKFTLTLPSL